MPGNDSFDEILSSTLKNYRDRFEDNIFNAMPLLYWMEGKGRAEGEDGGETIVEQLMYGKNETVSSYTGYDLLDVTPQTGFTAAEYSWKQVSGSVSIDGLTEMKNWGESRIINLLQAKITQLEESMRDSLTTMLFSDGSGNSSKDVNGLTYFLEETGSFGTIGGIDSSTAENSWWRNYSNASVGTWGSYAGINAMRTGYNTSSKGNSHPDLGLTTQDIFEFYERDLVPLERFTDRAVGDAGFENLRFKRMTLMYDDACPAQNMFLLTSKFLRWVYHTQRRFITTPFMRPEQQDARVSQILWMGNLTMSNRKRHARLSGITGYS